jgi:hypothetical protein
VWARAQPVRIADTETWSLCPEDLLLHLCLHATFHRKFVQEHVGLRPFCDIAETVRTLGLDWDRLTCTASAWGVRKHLYVALYISRELLGAAVPDAVMGELRPGQLDPNILEGLAERVLLRHEVPTHIPPRFVRLLAAETPAQHFQALWDILVPPDNATAEGSDAGGRRWGQVLLRTGQLVFHWRGFLWDFIRCHRSLMPVWVQRQAIDEWLEEVE